MDNELALLKQQVAELASIVEGLLARHPDNFPPPPQIAVINGSGQLLDYNGTSFVADTTAGSISALAPPGTVVLYRPQTQSWIILSGCQIAVAQLGAALSAGGTAAATFLYGGSGSVSGGVTDIMLCPGQSIASGSRVWIGQIAGIWYLMNAVCPC